MISPSPKNRLLAIIQAITDHEKAIAALRAEEWAIVAQLTETKPEEPVSVTPVFYDHNLISWGEDSETFRPQTYKLLENLWLAPNHFLSKEDVCQDVIYDDQASEGALKECIRKARQELEAVNFPYEIKTARGEGYGLKMRAGKETEKSPN